MCDSLIGLEGKTDESDEEQEDRYKKKTRQELGKPDDAELICASEKVLSDVGADMWCVISPNYLNVPARPLLQKCSHKRATETEHEAEEPDGVDKYCQSGGREWTLGRGTRDRNRMVGIGELFGYLSEERLGDDVGILVQSRVADGN